MDKIDVLTPLQKRLLAFLFSNAWFRRYFYLTGGTALAAFYLYHRYSDDLDFFCHDTDLTPIPNLFEAAGKSLGVKVEQVQKSPGFLRYYLGEELKIDIIGDVAFRVGVPELIENYMVDNLENIAVNKVTAILGRLDAKDYVDLYFILTKDKSRSWDIFELIRLGQKKDAGLDPFVWASLLPDVKNISILPRMMTSVTLKEIQEFFLTLRDQVLDDLSPKKKKSKST